MEDCVILSALLSLSITVFGVGFICVFAYNTYYKLRTRHNRLLARVLKLEEKF